MPTAPYVPNPYAAVAPAFPPPPRHPHLDLAHPWRKTHHRHYPTPRTHPPSPDPQISAPPNRHPSDNTHPPPPFPFQPQDTHLQP
ncbi:hypothetical protein BJ508DRAFT_58755 [Ascobolus immersus RN42]|uniref:Uncharacterized protein n=1 Tax=Ascobolus immersus RN42 TaxID=1160509 RepID=A0A3N4HIX2_ASCIM|nr:hypothetical protein BJ508DRAFT_58755 [Ascobolus immersus RN42]